MSNSPYTTNRILEIPQDIKLELNNGTLTLKAGSKVYVPNGFESDGTTPKFNVVTIDADKSVTPTNTGSNLIVLWQNNGVLSIVNVLQTKCASGNTSPGTGYFLWFDTTNNKIKFSSSANNTWVETMNISLPFCIGTTAGSSGMTSIDQIFNGFGYIGSTAFVLPDVKVQLPKGKNEDGTYISAIKTIPTVRRQTFLANYVSPAALVLQEDTYTGSYQYGNTIYFDSEKGYLVRGSDGADLIGKTVIAMFNIDNTGKILSMTPSSVDSFANSNMSNISSAGRSFIAGMGCPSDRAGVLVSNSFASSTRFTAPENGYFCLRMGTPAGNNCLVFLGNESHLSASAGYLCCGCYTTGVGGTQNVLMPVKKGQKVSAQHTNANFTYDAACGLWFIPCEGG